LIICSNNTNLGAAHPARGEGLKMNEQWKSIGLYEHPAKHQAGTYGNIVLSQAGVYVLRVGGSHMSCPQDWATKIHKEEGDERESAIIIRNVPESVRRDLKANAAIEGKSMQGLVLELITKYNNDKKKVPKS
jgi:hypothetical protein